MMTGAEYEAAIGRLGLTQEAAGTFLGVAGRTSRRWVSGDAPIPEAVALLLRVMVARGLDAATVQATGPVGGRTQSHSTGDDKAALPPALEAPPAIFNQEAGK